MIKLWDYGCYSAIVIHGIKFQLHRMRCNILIFARLATCIFVSCLVIFVSDVLSFTVAHDQLIRFKAFFKSMFIRILRVIKLNHNKILMALRKQKIHVTY